MNVLVVSWEYPPVVVGGLGRHVHALSRALADGGHDVVVLTRSPTGPDATGATPDVGPRVVEEAGPPAGGSPVPGCLRVLRVVEDPLHLEFGRDLVAWTLAWQHAAIRAAVPLLRGWVPDVVHAHDWLAAHAGVALADAAGVPLVATVHATEAGRNAGLSTTLQHQVHAVEQWLARRADALITCSEAMRREVGELFGAPTAAVVPNGIAARDWAVDPGRVAAARARWTPDGGPLLVHFGRLEHEKGVSSWWAGARTGTLWSRRPVTRATGSRSPDTCPTPTSPGPSRPRPRWCCPATTSRSASWRWRRPRPERRWSWRGRAASPRSSWTGRRGRRSPPATSPGWPTRSNACSTTRRPRRRGPGGHAHG
jgi:voltage-gated potassium channel Kch